MDKNTHYCILIVDDDARLCALLSHYFEEQELTVKTVGSGAEVDRLLDDQRFDLIVLDLMLPGEDGLSICRRLRKKKSPIPIIMLTAKGNDDDCILGLEAGADDYMAKPFNPRELLARIQAVIRRQPAVQPVATNFYNEAIKLGNVVVHLGARTIHRDGEEVLMTTGEFSLLKVLLQNPRIPLSREKLIELSRRRENEIMNRVVDVQISRIRKLVEDDPTKPRYIQTVWGFGYVFVPDGTAPAAA